VVPATYYGISSDWPMELPLTITFEDLSGKTRLTLRQADVPVGKDMEDCEAGWNGSFDKLAEALMWWRAMPFAGSKALEVLENRYLWYAQ